MDEIVIHAHTSDADSAELKERLIEFNFDATGYRDGRDLSCFLRDDGGVLYAGIDGFTWGGYAHIEYLWVDASRRGGGLGQALLRAAEVEAQHRGCTTIT